MSSFPYLSVLTVAPLVGAAVVACVPRTRPNVAKTVGLVWSLAVLVLTAVMYFTFKSNGPRFQTISASNALSGFEVRK